MKDYGRTRICTRIVVLLVALLAVFAAAFIPASGVAEAADTLSFTIKTEDGNNWQLVLGGDVIEQYSGRFFNENPSNPDAASSMFMQKIAEELDARGLDKDKGYTLSFEFPSFNIEAVGSAQIPYSTSGDFSGRVRAINYHSVVNVDSDAKLGIEYKAAGETAWRPNADGVPVGTYDVRMFAVEEFLLQIGGQPEQLRAVTVYSANAVVFEVEPSQATLPQSLTATCSYGAPLGNLSGNLGHDGKWTLSANQVEPELASGAESAILAVRSQPYTVLYDYTPNNANLLPIAGVEVAVTVTPKTLDIFISDKYAAVGEPPSFEGITYTVSGLVGDDTEEDLRITLRSPNLNPNAPGRYLVVADIDNPNYQAECHNAAGSQFFDGGRYFVFSASQKVYAADGTAFEVLLDQYGVTVSVHSEKTDISRGNLDGLIAYTFIFTDYGGAPVVPQEFAVRLLNCGVEGATHVGYYPSEGGWALVELGTVGDMLLAGAKATVYLFGKRVMPPAVIAVIVIACLLGVAIAAVIIAMLVGRKKRKDEQKRVEEKLKQDAERKAKEKEAVKVEEEAKAQEAEKQEPANGGEDNKTPQTEPASDAQATAPPRPKKKKKKKIVIIEDNPLAPSAPAEEPAEGGDDGGDRT